MKHKTNLSWEDIPINIWAPAQQTMLTELRNNQINEHVQNIVKYGEERYLKLWNVQTELDKSVILHLKSRIVKCFIRLNKYNYTWSVEDNEELFHGEHCTDWKNLVSLFNKISEIYEETCYTS